MEDVMSAEILRIREQIEKLVDEVFHLIERERELADEYIRFMSSLMKYRKSCGNIYSDS